MKKSSFVEGTIIATIAIVIVKILGMLYVIPFYAMIGVNAKALYAYAYNIYVIFLDISTAGLPIAISKLINEYDTLGMMEAKQRVYNLGKKFLFFVSIGIFLFLICFAPYISKLLIGGIREGNTIKDVTLAIRCVSLAILVVPFLSITRGYLQGHNIMNVSSISQIIEQVIRITIILLGVYLAIYVFKFKEVTAVCIAVMGAFFGALFAYLYVIKKIHDSKKELGIDQINEKDNISNKEIGKKLFSYSIPFIIINAIFSLYNFIDMVLISNTMQWVGLSDLDVEFVTTTVTTWAPKISMVITSIAMGMTMSLIPTIVNAYTLKKFDMVNNKLNQALQMIIMISLPMAVGLSMLSKPAWTCFYGSYNSYGPMILSLVVFVAFVGNIYMITSSTLQSLNKFKLVYKATIFGLLLNAILDVPLMVLFSKINIPPFLGASTASFIGYAVASLYVLKSLKKEHGLYYKDTLFILGKLIVPIIAMVVVVFITKKIVPVNYDSKMSCILYLTINTLVGGVTYLFLIYKFGIMKKVMGSNYFEKIRKKLTKSK